MTEETKPPPRKRRKMVTWLIIIFLIIILCLFVFYWFWGRFRERTTDAYVTGNIIDVTPQTAASVITLYIADLDYVQKGQLLVELDPTDAMLALENKKASLAESLRSVVKMFERVKELEAQAEIDQAELIKTTQDFEHRENLVESGGVSIEDFEHAEAALKKAFGKLLLTHHQLKAAIAEIDNTTITTHPRVEEAKSKLREAWVRLKRCKIYSPVNGIITQRKVQVGEWVNMNEPLMSIVPLNEIWAQVNFKEVQLKNLRIGQRADIKSDMYGRSVVFHGTVTGIAGGTGSVFSVLPPQNATGNWIKIVQRLPVRVNFDCEEIKKNPLFLGLSLEVTVHTNERDCARVQQIAPECPVFETDIFQCQLDGADRCIEEVIEQNVDPVNLEHSEWSE